jgi:hypothetical protein
MPAGRFPAAWAVEEELKPRIFLFDQARSTDPLIAAAAAQAIDKLQADAQFADFLARGQAGCRNAWVVRLDRARSQKIVTMLGAHGITAAEVSALDVHTPDAMRTILRPQATPNGDLYRVQVSIPGSDTAALTCLAKVFRLVNIQDDAATVNAFSLCRPEPQLSATVVRFVTISDSVLICQFVGTNLAGQARFLDLVLTIFYVVGERQFPRLSVEMISPDHCVPFVFFRVDHKISRIVFSNVEDRVGTHHAAMA